MTDKPAFPEKPSQKDEILAHICDVLGKPRPAYARTLKEWERAVFVYWFSRMIYLMEEKND